MSEENELPPEGTDDEDQQFVDLDQPDDQPEEPPVAEEPLFDGGGAGRTSTPKRRRIHIQPGVTIKLDSSNFLPSLPVLPDSPGSYTPILYTFRVKSVENAAKFTAVNVPFYIQIDHCIAVIWSLFNDKSPKKTIGISQLQWALYFLKLIFTADGNRSSDVQYCVNTIENLLLEEYANMAKHMDLIDSLDSNAMNNTSFNNQQKPLFSVNYNQMISKSGNKGRKICPMTENLFMSDDEIIQELASIREAAGIRKVQFDSIPKEKAFVVLSNWQIKQVEKIQHEFRMLRCIEDTIKTTDADNFTGYTEYDAFKI